MKEESTRVKKKKTEAASVEVKAKEVIPYELSIGDLSSVLKIYDKGLRDVFSHYAGTEIHLILQVSQIPNHPYTLCHFINKGTHYRQKDPSVLCPEVKSMNFSEFFSFCKDFQISPSLMSQDELTIVFRTLTSVTKDSIPRSSGKFFCILFYRRSSFSFHNFRIDLETIQERCGAVCLYWNEQAFIYPSLS